MSCPATHPERGLRCGRPAGNHPVHTATVPGPHGGTPVDWANESYVEPPVKKDLSAERKRKATQISASVMEHEISRLRPLARTGDPDTSHRSAELTRADIGPKLWEALTALSRPMTDVQLMASLQAQGVQITDRGPSKRRSDLVERGLVHDTGQRLFNPVTQREVAVWARTPAGEAMVQGERV